MDRAEIYRRAAEMIASGGEYYSCWAISLAADSNATDFECPESNIYAEKFCPHDGYPYAWAFLASKDWGAKGRVLALCFAAAMAETGDL